MSDKKICDVCGKEIRSSDYWKFESMSPVRAFMNEEELYAYNYDLCYACSSDVKNFINEMKENLYSEQ